jgi:hypothetical protein
MTKLQSLKYYERKERNTRKLKKNTLEKVCCRSDRDISWRTKCSTEPNSYIIKRIDFGPKHKSSQTDKICTYIADQRIATTECMHNNDEIQSRSYKHKDHTRKVKKTDLPRQSLLLQEREIEDLWRTSRRFGVTMGGGVWY